MADNYSFKDAGGNTVTHASKDIGSSVHASKHVPVDDAGVAIAKAEDAAHSSGDKGFMALAVRQDTAAALAGADGDYIPLIVDASGRLHVADSALVPLFPASLGNKAKAASLAVTLANEQINADNGTLATDLQPLAGYAQDLLNSAAAGITAGKAGALRMTTQRELLVAPRSRYAFGYASAVTNIADIEGSTTNWYSGYSTPAVTFFDGSDGGFTNAARFIRIPMLEFNRGAMIGIYSSLDQDVAVTLYADMAGLGINPTILRPTLDSATLVAYSIITGGSWLWFSSMPTAAGAAATIRYVPMLNTPMAYAVLGLVPAGDPTSGQLILAVTR